MFLETKGYSGIEKLKSRKLIGQLFHDGKGVSNFPIKIIYKTIDYTDDTPIKLGVSVSKRNFKKAVTRNRIKRLMREAYRLNKSVLDSDSDKKYVCMVLFLGKKEPNFNTLNTKFREALEQLNTKMNQQYEKDI